MSSPEKRVQELHLTLPPAPKPVAVYKTAVKVGNLLYVSGHGPLKADKTLITGRVGGAGLTLEQGKEAARQTGLAILATLKDTLGSLDKVKRLIKTYGMVNCTDDFLDQPKVINGFSELMKDVFGEDGGVGARSAVGHNSLPGNIAVEIECIFEVEGKRRTPPARARGGQGTALASRPPRALAGCGFAAVYDTAVTRPLTPSASVTNPAPTNSARASRFGVRSAPTTTTFRCGRVRRSLAHARYPLSSPPASGTSTACASVAAPSRGRRARRARCEPPSRGRGAARRVSRPARTGRPAPPAGRGASGCGPGRASHAADDRHGPQVLSCRLPNQTQQFPTSSRPEGGTCAEDSKNRAVLPAGGAFWRVGAKSACGSRFLLATAESRG
jgi:enamine deaminase RidA (YjgF/YER057c/UK114 family)